MSIVSVDCVLITGYAVTRPRPLSGSNSESSTVNADPSAASFTGSGSGGVVV